MLDWCYRSKHLQTEKLPRHPKDLMVRQIWESLKQCLLICVHGIGLLGYAPLVGISDQSSPYHRGKHPKNWETALWGKEGLY